MLFRSPRLHINEDDVLSIIEDDKPKRVVDLYNAMSEEVLAGMSSTFGTDKTESASAFVSTWEAMTKRPANYIDASLGLDTEETVMAYATTRLTAVDAYGLYRLQLISKYKVDKAAIEAE